MGLCHCLRIAEYDCWLDFLPKYGCNMNFMVAWILWSGFLDNQDWVLHYSQEWVGYEFILVEQQDETQDLHGMLLGTLIRQECVLSTPWSG